MADLSRRACKMRTGTSSQKKDYCKHRLIGGSGRHSCATLDFADVFLPAQGHDPATPWKARISSVARTPCNTQKTPTTQGTTNHAILERCSKADASTRTARNTIRMHQATGS